MKQGYQGGGYNQHGPPQSNSRGGFGGGGYSGNDGMYQTPSQYGGKSGYGRGGLSDFNGGGLGGGGQMGTGELRNFGYQPPSNGRGPVRATDLGQGTYKQNAGYGGMNGGYD